MGQVDYDVPEMLRDQRPGLGGIRDFTCNVDAIDRDYETFLAVS